MKKLIALLLFCILPLTALADNITVSQGSGKTMATDDVAGVNYQRMKLVIGEDGSVEGDLSSTRRMPIETKRTDGVQGTSGSDITTTTAGELLAAGTGGARYYIETLIVSNSHATQGTVVQLLDGSTVKAQCPAGPNYGGCVVNFPTPIRGTADTAVNCKALTSGAAVRCTVTGFSASN